MRRTIITPAVLPAAALAELKQWLGITVAADDAPLGRLLAAALEACEGFTGRMPLAQTCEEALVAQGGWQVLATRPVTAVLAVKRIDGTALPAEAYALELEADGSARVRLFGPEPDRATVRFTAGAAATWEALPEGLRHGIVRLAAHQHRGRDGAGVAPLPPASVVALWLPWRRVRLA
jgi:uncharacterized phiE125 gp8 family phage protein